MSDLTFEQLPKAVSEIKTKLDTIEKLLQLTLEQKSSSQIVEEYVTLKQLSKILYLSVPAVYEYVRRREIPYYKFGKLLYFSRTEINNWIASTRRKTMDEIKQEAANYRARKRR